MRITSNMVRRQNSSFPRLSPRSFQNDSSDRIMPRRNCHWDITSKTDLSSIDACFPPHGDTDGSTKEGISTINSTSSTLTISICRGFLPRLSKITLMIHPRPEMPSSDTTTRTFSSCASVSDSHTPSGRMRSGRTSKRREMCSMPHPLSSMPRKTVKDNTRSLISLLHNMSKATSTTPKPSRSMSTTRSSFTRA